VEVKKDEEEHEVTVVRKAKLLTCSRNR
jgi:hypothetical protein